MSIIKIRKQKNFSIISNRPFNDTNLSMKARGIWATLMSKPDDWQVYVSQLVKTCGDGKTAIYSGLKELKEAGYIEHVFIRDEAGRMVRGEYIVYEDPITVKTPANSGSDPYPENRNTGKWNPDNAPLLKTDTTKDKLKQKTDDEQKPPSSFSNAGFELVTALAGLISIVPEDFQTKAVENLIEKALSVHGVDYIKSSIQYSNDHSNGNTAQKYKAYLGKTIEGGWAYGYESASNKNKDVIANEFKKIDDNTLRAMAGAGNAWAVKELERRAKK